MPLDDLAEYIQSFLPQQDSHYYSVFITEDSSLNNLIVVRMPSHGRESFYKVEKEFDPQAKTTDDLVLLAKMCVRVVEMELEK